LLNRHLSPFSPLQRAYPKAWPNHTKSTVAQRTIICYNIHVSKKKPTDKKIIAINRRARHEYEFIETFEAGIELRGTEVKSLREGLISLQESYARIRSGELFLIGANISPYKAGSYLNHDPVRPRKLLMHKREISRLAKLVAEKRLTIVPVRLYFRRGMAKIEIALARGRQKHEKRQAIKEREDKRRIDQAMRRNR